MGRVAMGKFLVRRYVAGPEGQTVDKVIASGVFHFAIPYCSIYVARKFAATRDQIWSADRIVVVSLEH